MPTCDVPAAPEAASGFPTLFEALCRLNQWPLSAIYSQKFILQPQKYKTRPIPPVLSRDDITPKDVHYELEILENRHGYGVQGGAQCGIEPLHGSIIQQVALLPPGMLWHPQLVQAKTCSSGFLLFYDLTLLLPTTTAAFTLLRLVGPTLPPISEP